VRVVKVSDIVYFSKLYNLDVVSYCADIFHIIRQIDHKMAENNGTLTLRWCIFRNVNVPKNYTVSSDIDIWPN